MSRWLGLDLGGTNIKVVVIDRAAEASDEPGSRDPVVGQDQYAADAASGPGAVTANLVAAGRDAIERWGPVDGAGLGVPGLYDDDQGAIVFFPNLPGPWPGYPVRAQLQEALERPVAIVNDARAFTLAEARVGAAAGFDTVAAYVLGTGIGGGLVIGGHLLTGRHGRAGELGHVIVEPNGPECGCGARGCLEAVATSGALARRAGQPSTDAVFAAVASGDERAVAALRHVTDALGRAIAGVITVLWPERIVVGGGVAQAGEALFSPLREAVDRHVTLVDHSWYEIVPATLGPFAGAVGAALWAADSAEG
ncbi:ROK family protein [soil metagenome]